MAASHRGMRLSRFTNIMCAVTGVAVLWLIAGCGKSATPDGSDSPSLLTASSLGEQSVVTNETHLTSPEFTGTDSAWGERLAMQCRACHGLEAGSVNMLGPTLHGFFGKKAGSVDGFIYSDPLANAEFIWTPRALDAWLSQPANFLPGNRMAFAGLSKSDDRRAVIAYLLAVTDDSG